MTLAIYFGWWFIPLAITVISIGWAFWAAQHDAGWLGGVVLLFCLVPALSASALAWAIAGFFK